MCTFSNFISFHSIRLLKYYDRQWLLAGWLLKLPSLKIQWVHTHTKNQHGNCTDMRFFLILNALVSFSNVAPSEWQQYLKRSISKKRKKLETKQTETHLVSKSNWHKTMCSNKVVKYNFEHAWNMFCVAFISFLIARKRTMSTVRV